MNFCTLKPFGNAISMFISIILRQHIIRELTYAAEST